MVHQLANGRNFLSVSEVSSGELVENKYSVYELKAGLDKEISEFFLEEDFDLIEHYSNIKIIMFI